MTYRTQASTDVLTHVLGVPACNVEGIGKRTYRTRASTNELTRVLCIHKVSKREERRAWASTNVLARVPVVSKGQGKGHRRHERAWVLLARVLCVRAVSKRGRKGHGRALTCSLVSWVSPQCRRDREKDTQDTSEHRCARSCPMRPRGVEEGGK